ncbi:MAG: O-antigen ligase family protein [bacterium]
MNLSILLWIFIGIVIGLMMVVLNPGFGIGIPVLSLFVSIFFVNPLFAILYLIFIRPIINVLVETTNISYTASLSINLLGILNVCLSLVCSVYIMMNKVRIFKLPIATPYIIFLLINLISLFLTSDVGIGIKRWLILALPFIIYIVITNCVKTKRQITFLINTIVLSGIIPCLIGLYEFFTKIDKFDFAGSCRLMSTFLSSNFFGIYLTLILLIGIIIFIQYPIFSFQKSIMGLICLITLICLFLTFSRGSWIGFGGGILVIALLRYRSLLLFSLVLLIISLPTILIRFEDTSTFISRIALWKVGLNLFLDSPIIGMGIGTSELIMMHIFEGFSKGERVHIHNEYLRFAVDTGVIGLGAFLWILITIIRHAINVYKNTSDSYLQNITLSFIAIFTAYIIMSMNESIYCVPVFLWIFYAHAAILYVIPKIERENKMVDKL